MVNVLVSQKWGIQKQYKSVSEVCRDLGMRRETIDKLLVSGAEYKGYTFDVLLTANNLQNK